jgi:peptidoglycan DL-endopeptidase CwlO
MLYVRYALGRERAVPGGVGTDGEQMATSGRHRRAQPVRPWWRPLALSAASAAAITTFFNPLPASAAPQAPPVPGAPAVPDMGSRPQPLGTLTMPGQQAGTPAAATITTPGVAMTPLLQKIEKQRADIAALGDKLIRLGEDRDLANQQVTTAAQKVSDAQTALIKAEQDVAAAAAAAMRDQAALPPGTVGSGLADLDALAQMQRGESETEEAAARHLAIIRAAQASALAEQATATTNATDFARQYEKLNADIAKRQAALQKLEQRHAAEITASEAAQSAADRALGQGYLDGASQGRGADPRAVAALTFALAQRGDPYVWSEEGPDQYDCSGLMYAAYRTSAAGNFPLARVSRDQYYQTRGKSVDRYSLVPGDLLFFSSTTSWTNIHHVAMYAGNGMMVEAPRTGLTVRLVPVRWSRLFQATRIYGSVEGATELPDLNTPPPAGNPGTNPPPSSTPPSKPVSKPPVKPSKPPTSPPSTPPSSPSTPPSSSAPPASPTSDPPSSGGSSPSGGASSGGTPSSGTPSGGTPTGGTSSGQSPSGGTSGAQSPSGSQSAQSSASASASSSSSAAADD